MIDRTHLLYHTILEDYYIRVTLRATLVIYTWMPKYLLCHGYCG